MRDSDGATALNCMDKSTPLSFVKRLVNAGSNIESRDNDGYTPLCNAVMCEDIDIVKYLVKKKAKLEVTGNLFGSPLHIACRRVLTDIAKFLVEAKADVNQVQPTIMGTPLQAVARCWTSRKGEDQEKLIRYLVEEGKADVRVVGGLLGCALNAMCGWASAEMVKYLLGKGAKVDVPDSQGRVATHYAAVQSVHHFTPLINAEADIELKDKMERSTLHWAALGGRLDVVERVLYLSRSLVDQPDVDGWTPLLWAARQCGTEHNVGTVSAQKQIINFLIGQGADPCVVGKTLDGREWTTVKVARYHGVDEEVIELLIEKIKEKLENEGSADTWDDAVHASAKAQVHTGSCDSCLSVSSYSILGAPANNICRLCMAFTICARHVSTSRIAISATLPGISSIQTMNSRLRERNTKILSRLQLQNPRRMRIRTMIRTTTIHMKSRRGSRVKMELRRRSRRQPQMEPWRIRKTLMTRMMMIATDGVLLKTIGVPMAVNSLLSQFGRHQKTTSR
ncbi:ankyrin [Mollisia scopiformis]|uniref:Ankyrin n=1 Tax=Mollisia scopiformis TaxID=149040 RepID=A0A194X9P5_MOLSC|nr:ankyrin [Mollisia scopiformis]KUJ16883.1 ankyrin [Mollisia scopiformis]